MEAELKAIRKFIFDHFFEHTTPPVLEEIMQRFGVGRAEAFAKLKQVEADHHIHLVPGTQRILMANPYSGVTTPFKVYVHGKRYFANCAWDTVSMHIMLGIDARVESYCHHCAARIDIMLSNGKVASAEPGTPLVFLSTPVSKWYDNLIDTCSNNMVYLASQNHLNEWLSANPGLNGESLTVEKMAEVTRPLSQGRMSLDYERPPKADLMAYWASIGMSSEFWKF